MQIPEIMAHPWFNKSTPGIVYVPAPCVDELALPLASRSDIDPDLLASLHIIWGKHADIQKIKADLLSPAGKGTLAKAFYFLLQQYREQTLKDDGIILDLDDIPLSPGVKIVTKQYRSPSSKKGIEADVMVGNAYLQSSRAPPLRPPRTPSPRPLRLALPSTSCTRPASPVGPRPHRVRPVSSRSREVPTRHRSMQVGRVTEPETVHPELPHRTRASAVSPQYHRANQDPHSSYLTHNRQIFQSLSASSRPQTMPHFPGAPAHPVLNPCVIRAPVPISVVANEQVSANSIDTEMQPATGSDQDWVNIQSAWNNVLIQGRNQAQTEFHPPTRRYAGEHFAGRRGHVSPRGPGVNCRSTGDDDKENQGQYHFQQSYQGSNVTQARGGTFSGRPNEGRVGRELRNTLHGAREVMKENENKPRRMDFSLCPDGASTINIFTSSPIL